MVNLIGSHNSRNAPGALWPTRAVLTYGGNGLGEQHEDTLVFWRDAGIPERPPDLYSNPAGGTIDFAGYWYDDETNVHQRPFLELWTEAKSHHPNIDYFTFTNEAVGSNRHEMETYIAYERNMCHLAAADGFKLGIGKLANGTPHWDSGLWQELYAPWLVEAWDKWGAVYCRHVYGGDLVDEDGNISKAYPGYPYRIIDELEILIDLGWGGGVFFAECGLDGGYGVADWNRFYFQITKFEQALRPYAANVIGFAWWECGATNWEADYTNYLKQMRPYMNENSLPKWEGGAVVSPPPTDKPKIVIVKKPQKADMTEAENHQVSLWSWHNYGRTATHSTDDMLQMLRGGNAESYAVVWWADRQPDVIEALEAEGFAYVLMPEGEPIPPPVDPPPDGDWINVRQYFYPHNGMTYGEYVVFHFSHGGTQAQQLQRQPDGSCVLWKGEGQYFDNKKYVDYEHWRVTGGQVQKYIDTSDAGNGGRDAYNLHWAQWIPENVQVGQTYTSIPTVSRFNRTNCEIYSDHLTTDYLHIKELIPYWVSPWNAEISYENVLVIEWRKTSDRNVPPIEVYKFAPGVGYVEWNNGGVGEVYGNREPLGGELSAC